MGNARESRALDKVCGVFYVAFAILAIEPESFLVLNLSYASLNRALIA
jgi:hypothetical protein